MSEYQIHGVPRLQGRIGHVDEPDQPLIDKKWTFEIFLSIIGSGIEPERILQGPFYDTAEEAGRELRAAIKIALGAIIEKIPDAIPGQYVDLKTNMIRPLEEN